MPKLLFSRLKKLATAPSKGGSGASHQTPRPVPKNYQNTAVVLALAFLALRMIILSNQAYPLYGDEAQYWAWGQDLDWGYFSKPPLIAWLIRLSTEILGNTEFGVRFFAPVLHFITQILIFVVARRQYGAATGLAASLIYGVMPGVAVSGMVMSTDAPLIMFWALSLYFLQNVFASQDRAKSDKRAWPKNRIISVVGLGLALAFGMLSKYFMAVILLPIALTLVIMAVNKTNRQKIWRIAGDIGIALVLAAMLFAPNIWWNYQHAWVSVHHTGANAGVINGFLHVDSAGEFLLSQLAVFGPVAFLLLILIFWLYRHIFV
ncbi:MAG: glycosyltransferase family 39 protein, partial [Alphaproteobacteria bacterium]|nr:glycosyltransferase family 39 protein [Alphaproteobacteria bacterium]